MKLVVKEFLELCTCKLSRETGVPNSRIYCCATHPNSLAWRKSDSIYDLFPDSSSATNVNCTFRKKTQCQINDQTPRLP
jgi:uncharacterized protein (DUF1499 family)